jgi:hypothetical protein
VRILQNILLMIGVTCLGTVLGSYALVCLIASLQRPGGQPAEEGYGQLLGVVFCGAPVGAIAGLVGSLYWIVGRREQREWNAPMWLGVLLGLMAGSAATFRWTNHGGPGLWVAALLLPACATVGGMLASLIPTSRKAAKRSR